MQLLPGKIRWLTEHEVRMMAVVALAWVLQLSSECQSQAEEVAYS